MTFQLEEWHALFTTSCKPEDLLISFFSTKHQIYLKVLYCEMYGYVSELIGQPDLNNFNEFEI